MPEPARIMLQMILRRPAGRRPDTRCAGVGQKTKRPVEPGVATWNRTAL